ncbi:T9SS C-terminal target domain-containing protein [Hymenobacter sediminis]|uniref:T9SS type A sorting domain-containing protein n=1 Tax=Hymenobacter sediminis TaxID=2218621 RepID=UPI000DA650EA|nr:T9SS type A sorting domain-containing protein [Hymenobacter sediminis]RPD49672.1 T9SS C-terminal target domain-containing protein [Hymenobacter sediminis]
MIPFRLPSFTKSLLVTLAWAWAGLQYGWAAGAPIYSNTGNQGATTSRICALCVGSSVANPGQATDDDFNSAAAMQITAVGGGLRLRMDLKQPAPANYRAGVVVERGSNVLNLLSLNLANVLVVRTYLKSANGSTMQEQLPVDASVAGAILGQNTGKTRLEFIATKPFDQVELEAASLLNLGYILNVYYAYAIDANVVTTANGYVSRFEKPSSASYSTQVVTNGISVCVNSNVSNPQNAVDASLDNYATMGSLVDVSCPTTLQTQLEGTSPVGYQAGFVIGSGSVLDVKALDGLRVTTYLGGVAQESAAGSSLLNLELLGNGQYNVSFPTTKSFDRVEIRQTAALTALNDLRVYYGFGLEPRVFRDQAPRLSQFTSPTNNYQASGNIANPQNAADKDAEGSYATVNSLLGIGGTTRLKLRLDGPGRAGNVAGAILGLGTGLLDANLLSNIRVNTYTGTPSTNGGTDGAQLVESASANALLNLEVLANGQREVSFLTTRDFDWVEIEIASGVSALDNTRIYRAFAEDRPVGFPTSITVPRPLPVQLASFTGRPVGGGVQLVWQTSAELNSSHFVVERSVQGTGGFQPIGQVKAAGTTSAVQRYTLQDASAGSVAAPTLYYRLRQVDQDGTESLSPVVVVNFNVAPGSFAVYPNPATANDDIRAMLPSLPEGYYHLAVYNMQGGLVGQFPVTQHSAVLSSLRLSAGLYQVVLAKADGQRVATQRLVISSR